MSMENEVKKDEGLLIHEKYVKLNPREISNLCKLIEPLTKSTVADFGKCVYFTCVDTETVEIRYYNNPYIVIGKLKNQSGTIIRDFAMLVSTLRNLLSNSFTDLILVEKDGDINLLFNEQLMFLETRNLKKDVYTFTEKETPETINCEAATYAFGVVGSVLSQTERASEKIVIIKDGTATFNTGVFAAAIASPFSGTEEMVVYKQVVDSIAIIAETTKSDMQYGLSDTLVVKTDNIYCEFPVGTGERVKMFISPSTQVALRFTAGITLNDELLYKLVKFVQSLDYLSNQVKVSFTNASLIIDLTAETSGKVFSYTIPIIGGRPETCGDMNTTVNVLKLFLDIVGSGVKYSFNDMGLGIANDEGVFLIRKS